MPTLSRSVSGWKANTSAGVLWPSGKWPRQGVAARNRGRTSFYNLEGSNNIIMLTTERYHDYPMTIQGYGAGADVTAAGVFADIMSVANI